MTAVSIKSIAVFLFYKVFKYFVSNQISRISIFLLLNQVSAVKKQK